MNRKVARRPKGKASPVRAAGPRARGRSTNRLRNARAKLTVKRRSRAKSSAARSHMQSQVTTFLYEVNGGVPSSPERIRPEHYDSSRPPELVQAHPYGLLGGKPPLPLREPRDSLSIWGWFKDR